MPLIPLHGSDGNPREIAHDRSHNVFSRSVADLISTGHKVGSPEFGPILEMRDLGNFSSINATAILAENQQHALQVIATTTSSISLASALIAIYWFCMMRRNFRRDLVLLLIAGGSWKSLWFVVFSAKTFVDGVVETNTAFCQGAGYMLQVGFELCDFAVFFMSLHMYLQIFPPAHSLLGHDGLYRVRHWVGATWFILPNLSGALAFINPRPAFMAQGGFCSLPLRPIWYKLALFWVPRYLIWLFVIFVAVSIYRYVGSEFRVFGQEKDSSTSLRVPGESSVGKSLTAQEGMPEKRDSAGIDVNPEDDPDESCAPDDVIRTYKTKPKIILPAESAPSVPPAAATRRQSLPGWVPGFGMAGTEGSPLITISQSTPNSRRGSRQKANGVISEEFTPPLNVESGGHRGSVVSIGSVRSSGAGSLDGSAALPPIHEGERTSVSATSTRAGRSANRAIKQRRRAIQRQLRLLFIYPCVYMLLWIVPFVVNCMNYFDYWAQHPIFALRVVQIICLTAMTFGDVFIFSWRERPWRHIPASDGTFLGSFMFWRFCFQQDWADARRMSKAPSYVPDEKEEQPGSRTGVLKSFKPWLFGQKRSSPRGSEASGSNATTNTPRRTNIPHKRTFSGGSDRKHLEAERAHERLALERAEYEQNRISLQERRTSVISTQLPERKEWFDTQ